MNYDQNDCRQFSLITPLFPTLANTLKTKVCDVVGYIFEVECSVGGFLILKQIIPRRSQVTGQDTGCVATFPGRPFHDLRCYKNFETNSTFKVNFDKSLVKFVKVN
jgi:hypothetical protein